MIIRYLNNAGPHLTVTMTLKNTSLMEILRFMAEQTHLQLSVENYAVYLHPEADVQNISVEVTPVPSAGDQSRTGLIQGKLQSILI